MEQDGPVREAARDVLHETHSQMPRPALPANDAGRQQDHNGIGTKLMHIEMEIERLRQELAVAKCVVPHTVSSCIPPRWQLLLPPHVRPAALERPAVPAAAACAGLAAPQSPPSPQLDGQRFHLGSSASWPCTAGGELIERLQNAGNGAPRSLAAIKGEGTTSESAAAAEMLASIADRSPGKRRLEGEEDAKRFEAVQGPLKVARLDVRNKEQRSKKVRAEPPYSAGAGESGSSPDPQEGAVLLLLPPGRAPHQAWARTTWTTEAIEARANEFREGGKRMVMRKTSAVLDPPNPPACKAAVPAVPAPTTAYEGGPSTKALLVANLPKGLQWNEFQREIKLVGYVGNADVVIISCNNVCLLMYFRALVN